MRLLKSKKGAMFGLDARIALAIFGALSVISGAALYSAIQQAKVIAQVVEFKSIAKALESYLLDIGTFIPTTNSSSSNFNMDELLENPTSNPYWNGPYINLVDLPSSTNRIKVSDDFQYLGYQIEEPTSCGGVRACTVTDCNLFIGLDFVKYDGSIYDYAEVKPFMEAIDLYVDGSLTPLSGQIRYSSCINPIAKRLFYLVAPLREKVSY